MFRMRLVRLTLAVGLLSPGVAVARQSDVPTIPGFSDPGKGAAVVVAIAGPFEELPDTPVLVVERFDLAAGDTLDALDGPAVLAVESGRATVVDDLGLEAILAPDDAIFAPGGLFGDLEAAQSTRVLRISVQEGRPDADALLAAELDEASARAGVLTVTIVELPAGADLGDGAIVDPTALVALDAPLAVTRPGRPASNLPAGRRVLLPVGTELAVANDGTADARVLTAAITPTSPPATATPTRPAGPTATPEDRGSTRPAATPTRTTGGGSTSGSTIDDYLPPGSVISAAGFSFDERVTNTSPADSWFTMNSETERAWQGSIDMIYVDRSENRVLYISLEQFGTTSAARNLYENVDGYNIQEGNDLTAPRPGRFDEALASFFPANDDDRSLTSAIGLDGKNILIVAIFADAYDRSTEIYDIFDAIAGGSGGTSTSTSGFVPSAAEISQAGFTLGETTTSRDVTDSTFTMNASTEAGWLSTTLTVITGYAPDGEWINANIRIEEFTSASSANGLFLDIDEGFRADGAWQRPPGAGRFDQITMMYDYRTEYDYTNTVIIARYDATVVVVSVWGDVGADTTPVAVDLFALIS
jgi:hypothetical protein